MGEGSEMDDEPDQEDIRQEYEELMDDIRAAEDEVTSCENSLTDLQNRCLHPNMGKGRDTNSFDVASNECPDCGFCKEA